MSNVIAIFPTWIDVQDLIFYWRRLMLILHCHQINYLHKSFILNVTNLSQLPPSNITHDFPSVTL
ncbi:hypothetical protein Mapa_008652 [Marchantia paleacea]|nr:hypothetical protein Mapa_008652 [Marchantia paleacea]